MTQQSGFPHRPAWLELGLGATMVVLFVLALIAQLWGAAVGAAVLVLAWLPRVLNGLRSILHGERWDSDVVRPLLPFRISSQILVAILVVLPLLIWRAVSDGVVAIAVAPIAVIFAAILYSIARRRESLDSGVEKEKTARDSA